MLIAPFFTVSKFKAVAPHNFFAIFGHSYAATGGTATGLVNAYRTGFLNESRTVKGYDFRLVGQTTGGTVSYPYYDAANGAKAADMQTQVSTNLALDFPSPNEHNKVLMGPIEYNDLVASTNLTTFYNSVLDCMVQVHNYSNRIKTYLITGLPGTTNSIAAYETKVIDAYNAAITLGYNVILIDSYTAGLDIPIWTDGIHPTSDGYDTWGAWIADQVCTNLGV